MGISRRRIGTATLFALSIALIAAGVLGFASQAQAAPVSMTFDNGRLSLGALLRDQHVLPAPDRFPSDSLPTPQRTDMQLTGTETDGQLSFPASSNSGLQFPYMAMDHPVEDLKIPVTMRLNEPGLTGTWNSETGAVTIAGSVDLIIITGTGTTFPLPDSFDDLGVPSLGLFARCRIANLPVSFSTAGELPYAGQPYAAGLGGTGAISTGWSDIPEIVSENGGDCGTLSGITRFYGGMWLSNGVVETEIRNPPLPTCDDDPQLCPDPVPAATISSIRLDPKLRRVRSGRVTVLRLRITNSGDADALAVRVAMRSSNRRVRVRRRLAVTVPAGSTVLRRVRVKVRPNARGRAVIAASTAGIKARTVVTVLSRRRRAAAPGVRHAATRGPGAAYSVGGRG